MSTGTRTVVQVRILWLLLCLLWIAAEIRLARKNRVERTSVSDCEEQSQRILWITLSTGVVSALIFKTLAWAPIPIDYLSRQVVAFLLFAAGLCLRYFSVDRLGPFFTTNVSIRHGHKLIISGPYRWVRHPSYTGLLIALAAAGLAMGDLFALLLLTVPGFFAFRFRIGIEEKLLDKKFGAVYRKYRKQTWKLLPWLY